LKGGNEGGLTLELWNFYGGEMNRTGLIAALALFALAGVCNATIINVPDDYATIQAGIDASEDGDTVLVQPGRYVENIDFNGHSIVLVNRELDEDDPEVFSIEPEDTLLHCLPGDTINFIVRARDEQGGELSYLWFVNEDTVGYDTTYTFVCPEDYRHYLVSCRVADDQGNVTTITWYVSVVPFYIVAIHPDSFLFAIPRRTAVDFWMTLRTDPNLAPIEYQWLLDGREVSEDSALTISFDETGDYFVEGVIHSNEEYDVVVWEVVVRILIGWISPDNRDTLEVNLGDTVTFRAVPFNPQQSLSYYWMLDRRRPSLDDSGTVVFDEVGLHHVSLNVYGGREMDRIIWTVNVNDPHGISEPQNVKPETFSFIESYPNPFNAQTVASYELRGTSFVSLRLYDISGRLVQTIDEGWQTAGTHRTVINGARLASGVYLLKLAAGNDVATKKIICVR
jgi:hypothetical protein